MKRKVENNAPLAESSMQRRLLEYLRSGRVHPFLCLTGPDPDIKLATAKAMAKFLFCRNRNISFCEHCSTCTRIEKEIHPDVLFIREAGEETIKIDVVRDLCHEMEIGPLENGSGGEPGQKICIIDECHRMTTPAANAFLKTLEEPGPGRHFWLLSTQAGALLPTLVSRSLQFVFPPSTPKPIEPSAQKKFRELFEGYVADGSLFPLIESLDDKAKALSFVQYLQSELRDAVLDSQKPALLSWLKGRSVFEIMPLFEEAIGLEGRLRSHANYGLMLESFLRENFVL